LCVQLTEQHLVDLHLNLLFLFKIGLVIYVKKDQSSKLGNNLLSRALRRSTIGDGGGHF
jgi:hypothetical protein